MKDAYKTLIEQYEDILKDNEGEQQKELSLASDDAKSPTEPHGVLQASRPTRGAVPADNANPAIVFEVNDMVLAKWQGDRSYYPARIINRTGPRTNFQYQVKFKTYDNTEMVKASDIKPMASNQHNKRKAEEISANATPPVLPTPQNSNIISAAASVDPKLANQARKEPNQTSDGALKPAKIARKVKANKELEAGKSKWQNFTKGKTGKAGKKESMFRTPDGINARGKYDMIAFFHTHL